MTSFTRKGLRHLAMSFLFTSMVFTSVQAGMIGTETISNKQHVESNIQMIQATLLRDDVKQALLAHGIDPQYAQQRIDRLTDQEILQLAHQFDQLPAASGAGLILFATGPIVFMLELMGLTDLTTTF